MSAGTYNFNIEQGASLTVDLTYRDSDGDVIDVSSGYTARMKIREASGGDLIASTESGDSPKNTLAISLGDSTSNIVITMTSVNTAALDFDTAVYDLELASGSNTVDRIIEGSVKLSKEITV